MDLAHTVSCVTQSDMVLSQLLQADFEEQIGQKLEGLAWCRKLGSGAPQGCGENWVCVGRIQKSRDLTVPKEREEVA